MQLSDLSTSKRLRLTKQIQQRWQQHLNQFADRAIVQMTLSEKELKKIHQGGSGHPVVIVEPLLPSDRILP